MENLSVLVTGGAGFIGSHIVEFLLNNGAKYVRILDNLSTGSIHNINHLFDTYPNLEFVEGDITNFDTCMHACNNINIICHQAAFVSVPLSVEQPNKCHDINVNGFLNILNSARQNNIKRIVYASTSVVYDNDNNEFIYQYSPYATTKYINELYAKLFTNTYNLECIGLRYFNVFGPRQNPKAAYAAAIPKFIDNILKNNPITIYGDGNQCRDFVYVDNIVNANILAILTDNVHCYGEVFDVGTGVSVSINTISKIIFQFLNKTDYMIKYDNPRNGDVSKTKASIEKIRLMMKYDNIISFEQSLENTIEYYKTVGI